MHLITRVSALLALAATVLALKPDDNFDAITKPGLDEEVPAGETYTIEWIVPDTAPDGPVTIGLVGGKDDGGLNPIGDIGKAENSDLKFDWDVDSSLGANATYGLTITLDADPSKFQYSTPFRITGGTPASNSTSSDSAGPTTITGTVTSSSKGSKSTGSSSSESSGTATTTAETTAEASTSTSGTESPSGTTPTPATKTTDSGTPGGRARAALGLLGGLAVAAAAL